MTFLLTCVPSARWCNHVSFFSFFFSLQISLYGLQAALSVNSFFRRTPQNPLELPGNNTPHALSPPLYAIFYQALSHEKIFGWSLIFFWVCADILPPPQFLLSFLQVESTSPLRVILQVHTNLINDTLLLQLRTPNPKSRVTHSWYHDIF